MVYRISNNGLTGWRPAISEVRAYSDSECAIEVDATFVDMSGHNSGHGDGSAAFDNTEDTLWRPQCQPCGIGEAWLSFAVAEEIECVRASDLGQGAGGSEWWNGGIKVELQNADSTWTTAMESTSGNSASTSLEGKLIFSIDLTLSIRTIIP